MKLLYYSYFISILFLSMLLTGCSSTNNNSSISKASSDTENSSDDISSSNNTSDSDNTRVFTLDELKTYNGQNGSPAYVAVDGIVYDVSDFPKWKNGQHHELTAGNDLTEEFANSPHSNSTLKKLPIVGILE